MKRNQFRLATWSARTLGVGAVMPCAVLFITACSPPRDPISVKSSDPTLKIPAIKQDVRERNTTDVAQMVKDLDSDDPAVRFYSIEGLRRLTGDTFGYHYYDDDAQRRPAVMRWEEWMKNRGRS
jgi:hypothetical protein